MSSTFVLNGLSRTADAESDTPLLWVLRENLGLTGTKYGCGVGECGACTVHLQGQAVRSCVVPIAAVQGQAVTTIEGLSSAAGRALQRAWVEHQVPQCGYCQSGVIMAAESLLRQRPDATEQDLAAALTNLCRCGTYPRMRVAFAAAAEAVRRTIR